MKKVWSIHLHDHLFLTFPHYKIQELKTSTHCMALLSLNSSLVLFLLQEPLHPSVNALLEGPQRLVLEHTLGLGDVEEAGHGGDGDLGLGEGRRAL